MSLLRRARVRLNWLRKWCHKIPLKHVLMESDTISGLRGEWQVLARGPPCGGIPWKCLPSLSLQEQRFLPAKARQQRCCRGWPTTQHTPAEHPGAHCKHDHCYWATSLKEQNKALVIIPTGDPLQHRRQASDSQLLISWINLAQEARPCHVCPWRLELSPVDQPSEQSETEWLCVDVSGSRARGRAPRTPQPGDSWQKGGPQIWLSIFDTAYRSTRTELTKNWFHTFPLSIFIVSNMSKELIFTQPITS